MRNAHRVAAPSALQHVPLDSLAAPAQTTISTVIGKDQAAYHAIPSVGGYRVANAAQRLVADFSRDGVRMQIGHLSWQMTLRGIGYAAALHPVTPADLQVNANRIEFQRGVVKEWYVNGPLGLEQGFTIASPPTLSHPAGAERLTLALELSGDLTAFVDANRTGLTLKATDGAPILRYAGLAAYDAAGRQLTAWLEASASPLSLQIRVDDTDAQYPITIDPIVQAVRLTASDGVAGQSFGNSVSISGDTIVIGASAVNSTGDGAAYVFVKPSSGWAATTSFAAKLLPSDGTPGNYFGASVSISGDIVAVGAIGAAVGGNIQQGAAYIFVKPSGGWATASLPFNETAKLTTSDGAAADQFGYPVSINGDTVVIGAFDATVGSNPQQGAAYIFVKPSGGWATTSAFTAKLTASDGIAGDAFGYSASISGDTIVLGADLAKLGGKLWQGAVYIFSKPAGGWATTSSFTAKLTASDGASNDFFGRSVAIDGDTIVIGANGVAPNGNFQQGAAYVFVKPSGGWTTSSSFTAKLTASDGAAFSLFGISVSISGNKILVGADGAQIGSINQGAAYVFVKPTSGWATTSSFATKLTASDGTNNMFFGEAVSMTGTSILVGAYTANIGSNIQQGAAYIFENVPGSVYLPLILK